MTNPTHLIMHNDYIEQQTCKKTHTKNTLNNKKKNYNKKNNLNKSYRSEKA